MADFLKIDGALGEGGGQVLRSSISLSAILGIPVEVFNIRSNRSVKGLRPQHLAAVKAVADLFGARTDGMQIGSERLTFIPADFRNEAVDIDVGTAGSIPLILLTMIPAVALSGNKARVRITGGTDVKASPTMDYLRLVIGPAYRMIGLEFKIEILRRGYYPEGGGLVAAEISPCAKPVATEFLDLRASEPSITSVCSKLPKHVADRQISSALAALEKSGIRCRMCTSSLETSLSPGSSILVYSASEFGPLFGGDCIGELGKPAEAVGKEAAKKFLDVTETPASVDPNLADMLVVPLSLADGISKFRTSHASRHLMTNLEVASMFTGCSFCVRKSEGKSSIVEIRR